MLVNIYLFSAYIILGLLSFVLIIYSSIIGLQTFKNVLWRLILAAFFLTVGIVIHTFPLLYLDSEKVQMFEFVLAHILLLAGSVVLLLASYKFRKLSEEIGFAA